jgi:WD40 repeat protein
MKPYAEQIRPLVFAALALCVAVCAPHEAAAQTGGAGVVTALAFSPDDRSLFVARDREVMLRDTADGRTLRVFRGHLSVVTSLAVSGDGKSLLTSGEDGAVKLWDVETGRVAGELAKGTPGDDSNYDVQVKAVAFSPDGRLAAWGDNAGDLTLWDVSAGTRLRALHEEPRAGFECVAFSTRGDAVFTAGIGGAVTLWDVKTGRKILTFEDDPVVGVRSMSVSQDGRRVLTVSGMDIRLWDSAKGKELLVFSEVMDDDYYSPHCAAFMPDGRHAISGDDGGVYVWDLKKGRVVKTLRDPPFGHVESVAVSHGGEFVAAGDVFGNVRVWRYATGRRLWPEGRRGNEAEAE